MVPRTSLPWSEDLIYNVSDILSTADITSDIYLREQGTENAFKQLSGSATDIIHLYTHGFYMEGITEYQDSDVELSPMMRSGLVMAGSPEVALNSDNDGLLLAREIADMDLSYVDIVFLSACQTAQGEITSDGVVGIQRGLKQAGVNSIIMTLWEVDAMMSVYLVEEFYRALSQPGATKRDAFREARRKARENYPTLDWAAYIMLD
jgi:CHAT domain-containing protein